MTIEITLPGQSDRQAAPIHCGDAMTLLPGPAGMHASERYSTWRCLCGFRMDTPWGASLSEIAAAIGGSPAGVPLLVSP